MKIKKSCNGTSQKSRAFNALDSEYVKIDERSFEDLIISTSEFSKLINYYNLNNKKEGDWSAFLNDETFVIASIIDVDPYVVEIDFRKYLYKANLFNRHHKKMAYYEKCFIEIHKIATLFQYWFKSMTEIENSTKLESIMRLEIENVIVNKLSISLMNCRSLVQFMNSLNVFNIEFKFSEFASVWYSSEKELTDKWTGIILKEDPFPFIAKELELIFQSFHEMLLYFKTRASDCMEQSIMKNTHSPEVGLFLAFLHLFKITQKDINTIGKRHLEYYYSQVVKQKPLKGQCDKLYLSFEMYENNDFSTIKKNTEFLAGEDKKGNDVVYITDDDIQVNQARIHKVKNIFIDKKTINIDGVEKEICTKILSLDIPIDNLIGKISANSEQRMYAAFGESQQGKGLSEKTMEDTGIGFAISSPVLFLNEGLRELSIELAFLDTSYSAFLRNLQEISRSEKLKEEEFFAKVFSDAFLISITSEKGWMDIANYIISKEDDRKVIKIEFDLDETNPSIIAFDEKLHDGNFSSLLPIVKIGLNPESYIY
ncbi:MAG TPA: hypothetical protein VNW06_13245, partial [Cytophagaceae bacterium]|nr:hypothetical protein [Cytophagaceae bacterium]